MLVPSKLVLRKKKETMSSGIFASIRSWLAHVVVVLSHSEILNSVTTYCSLNSVPSMNFGKSSLGHWYLLKPAR